MDEIKKDQDWCTAMHEAGHFIFFLRALIMHFGRKGAKKAALSLPELTITLERRWHAENVRKKRVRHARFRAAERSQKLGLNAEEEFLISAGGLAIDVITGRRTKDNRLILNKLAETYEVAKARFGFPYKVIVKDDMTKSITYLMATRGKLISSSEFLSEIMALVKSLTRKEENLLNEVAKDLIEGLRTKDAQGEGEIVLNLLPYVKRFL